MKKVFFFLTLLYISNFSVFAQKSGKATAASITYYVYPSLDSFLTNLVQKCENDSTKIYIRIEESPVTIEGSDQSDLYNIAICKISSEKWDAKEVFELSRGERLARLSNRRLKIGTKTYPVIIFPFDNLFSTEFGAMDEGTPIIEFAPGEITVVTDTQKRKHKRLGDKDWQ